MDVGTADLIVCPLCHGPYDWTEIVRHGSELRSARLRCPACGTRAAVRDGLGLFRPGDAPDPEIRPPADPEPAVAAVAPALPRIPDGWPATSPPPAAWLVERVPASAERVLELGPGSGTAAAGLLRRGGTRPIAVEENLPRLAEVRQIAGATGWDGFVADAHSIPFADRSVPAAVSEFGLQNSPGPYVTLRELRRIVAGELYAVAAFLTGPDGANQAWARAAGVAEMYDEERCLATFRKARWQVEFEPRLETLVRPPPEAGDDRFPREEARVRWGLLTAR